MARFEPCLLIRRLFFLSLFFVLFLLPGGFFFFRFGCFFSVAFILF